MLFRSAQALAIKPDKHEALYNWGFALSDQAKTKSGVEADELFKQSYEKYAKAVEIKPDKYEAFNNWGAALAAQAKTKSGAEADDLFEKAINLFEKSESILVGSSAYNLACLFALTSQEEKCQNWLMISKDTNNLPNREYLEGDSDLDSIRNTKWFQKFLNGLRM